MNAPSFPERVRSLDRALGEIPHAFGGALALAYYADPRATVDIDVNVFVSSSGFARVAQRLEALGVGTDDPELEGLVERDGQVRVMWDKTPIDLFFSYDAFHDEMATAIRTVPFDGESIQILSPEHLMVCKVVFNRPKDWVDLDAMLATGIEIDVAEVLRWVARIAGDEDPRYTRVVALLTTR